MALLYYKYNTNYGNTIVDKSEISFAPVSPYEEIHIDFNIPDIQPLYLYANSGGTGGTIVVNSQENVDLYLASTELPPTSDGNVTYGEYTGSTAALSATTSALVVNKVNVSGDTMHGRLYFAASALTSSFGYIGKNELYSGLEINGSAGISLNTPYLTVPQWSGNTGSYLTVGGDGLITLTAPPTGATSWQSTGGTNSIVANVPEDLGFNVVPTQNVSAGTAEWNIDFTNDGNQDATVTLTGVVDAITYGTLITYTVPKNQTSRLFGSIPIFQTILSGSTVDVRIASNKNGTVIRSLLRITESGAGSPVNVDLQQVTSVGAQTNIETTLGGGLVTSKIRPATNSVTALQIRKADGTTVVANFDTVSGFTGFGLIPTAVVHIKAGTTSAAPLKFTSGALLASPQTGAVEFLGNEYYGTTTGGTRNTFAFLESPQFTGAPDLPIGTTLNSQSLSNYILTSGGTNNTTLLKKTTFATYTGTTAPATYLSKTAFNTYSGTTVPNTYYNKTQINTYTGATLSLINGKQATITGAATTITSSDLTINRALISNASGKVAVGNVTSTELNYLTGATSNIQAQINARVLKTVFSTYTGTTAPATYASKTAFNTFTGTTAPATYLTKSAFNTYSGTTLTNINSRLLTSAFNTYSGTTVPATYLTKSAFNTYSGTTLTNINSRLLTSAFNTYSGTTVPNTYYNKTCINTYTGTTLTNINSRLLTSAFNTYSGTTVPNTYYNKTQINSYTGATATAIGLKANIASPTFTGTVRSVTPAVNDSSTCIATTAWYFLQCSNSTPLMNGTGTVGTSTCWAHGDHVHPSDTSRVAVTLFNTYTGTTAPAAFASKSVFNTYTGTTAPATYLGKTAFNTYSGTTVPNTYYNKTCINTYTGATATAIGLKANIASPTFTGTVRSVTPAVNDNSTCIATTAWYIGQGGTATPLMDGVGACGTSNLFARQDHVHPRDTSKLSLSGGTMTGTLNGTIMCASSCLCSPITIGTTCLTSPITCGTTCSISPITIGSTCVCSPVILGSTSICSPTVCASTLLYSGAKTCLIGATTGSTLFLTTTPPEASMQQPSLFWDATTKQIEVHVLTGGSDQYFYGERTTNATTTSTTCVKALGLSGTTLAGRYQINFSAEFGNATANACTFGAFKIDNVTQGTNILTRDNVANHNKALSFSRDVTLTAALHCFDIWFWNSSGTACVPISTIRVKRIS